MPEVQAAPLAHYIEYFFDGALDMDEIGAFCHVTLGLYGDRPTINGIVEFEESAIGQFLKQRQKACLRLDAYAHEVAAELPPATQRSLFAADLLYQPKRAKDLAEVLCGWNFEDSTVGGCLEDFRDKPRLTPAYAPTPRLARRLAARSAIRRYVVRNDEVSQQRIMISRLRRLPWPDHPDEAKELEPIFAAAKKRYAEARERAYAAMCTPDRVTVNKAACNFKREAEKHLRERRRVLRRSAVAASAILGAATVGAFARGEPVVIAGQQIAFSVKAHNLHGQGHGALDVDVHDPAGQKLGDLCLYFDDMPALDQLAAVALHVGAGNEKGLLDTGNLTGITAAGSQNPAILAKKRGSVGSRRNVKTT